MEIKSDYLILKGLLWNLKTMVFSSKSKKGSRNQGLKWLYEKSVKIKIDTSRKTVKHVIHKEKILHAGCKQKMAPLSNKFTPF